jgi:hypothetical protein
MQNSNIFFLKNCNLKIKTALRRLKALLICLIVSYRNAF